MCWAEAWSLSCISLFRKLYTVFSKLNTVLILIKSDLVFIVTSIMEKSIEQIFCLKFCVANGFSCLPKQFYRQLMVNWLWHVLKRCDEKRDAMKGLPRSGRRTTSFLFGQHRRVVYSNFCRKAGFVRISPRKILGICTTIMCLEPWYSNG